jgi:hypothetical protein
MGDRGVYLLMVALYQSNLTLGRCFIKRPLVPVVWRLLQKLPVFPSEQQRRDSSDLHKSASAGLLDLPLRI